MIRSIFTAALNCRHGRLLPRPPFCKTSSLWRSALAARSSARTARSSASFNSWVIWATRLVAVGLLAPPPAPAAPPLPAPKLKPAVEMMTSKTRAQATQKMGGTASRRHSKRADGYSKTLEKGNEDLDRFEFSQAPQTTFPSHATTATTDPSPSFMALTFLPFSRTYVANPFQHPNGGVVIANYVGDFRLRQEGGLHSVRYAPLHTVLTHSSDRCSYCIPSGDNICPISPPPIGLQPCLTTCSFLASMIVSHCALREYFLHSCLSTLISYRILLSIQHIGRPIIDICGRRIGTYPASTWFGLSPDKVVPRLS